jgi:hypothetical protein
MLNEAYVFNEVRFKYQSLDLVIDDNKFEIGYQLDG